MRKKIICLLCLAIAVTACAAVYWKVQYDEKLIKEWENKALKYEEKNSALNQELLQIKTENQELQTKLDSVLKEWNDMNERFAYEIHLQPIMDGGDDYSELFHKQIMTKEKVKLRKIPANEESLTMPDTYLSYSMVTPMCAVYGESYEDDTDHSVWILIQHGSLETLLDTVGWVQMNELMEYTEENKHLLTFPIGVAEGTINLETGEPVDSLFTSYAEVEFREDYALIWAAGGQSCKVKKEAVVYPEP